jgi:hypothetical protein
MPDRKELIREYKETPRPAGVCRVRNVVGGRSLLGSSSDVPAVLNRVRFQLDAGLHPDKELQKDWRELGADAFVFETLDLLEPSVAPGHDPAADLQVLKEMWLEKLTASGEGLYERSARGSQPRPDR